MIQRPVPFLGVCISWLLTLNVKLKLETKLMSSFEKVTLSIFNGIYIALFKHQLAYMYYSSTSFYLLLRREIMASIKKDKIGLYMIQGRLK